MTITSSFDSSAPFDAATLFKDLRAMGLAPHVFDGHLIFNVPDQIDERYRELFGWASRADVGGLMQREHARDRWHARGEGEAVVQLG